MISCIVNMDINVIIYYVLFRKLKREYTETMRIEKQATLHFWKRAQNGIYCQWF